MKLNGKEITLKGETTLTHLLEARGYRLTRIAVELNGRIVPKEEYPTTLLKEEDVLEVVTFVGGG